MGRALLQITAKVSSSNACNLILLGWNAPKRRSFPQNFGLFTFFD
jgi:hypothetical protein